MEATELAKLKAQYGEVFSIVKAGVEIIYRGPTAEELDRFLETTEASKPQACLMLVTSCILSPSIPEFEVLRARKPGILYGDKGLVSKIQEASGMAESADSKSL
jgi:hypothetical protein